MYVLLLVFIASVHADMFDEDLDTRWDGIPWNHMKNLVLVKGELAAHRRVDAVPQLQCIRGNACGVHEPEVVHCEAIGSEELGGHRPLWKCQAAELPNGVRLGTTDVSCEGYDSPDDDRILAGSCSLEYSLHKDHGEPSQLFFMLCMVVLIWGLMNLACDTSSSTSSERFRRGVAIGAIGGYLAATHGSSYTSRGSSRSSYSVSTGYGRSKGR